VGSGRERLRQLRALLDDYDFAPESLYPTHVERNEELMQEAVDLSRRGVTVDVDTVEHDLSRWVSFFLQRGGDPSRLTASSDAAINSPGTLLEQVRDCVLHGNIGLETILPIVTVNTARVLKLQRKGRLAVGCDADVLVLRRDSLAVAEVIAMGRPFVSGGNPAFRERFLEKSNRRIELHGGKA
jgi:beta-aspartyl-dipeptidase (metallo-type)